MKMFLLSANNYLSGCSVQNKSNFNQESWKKVIKYFTNLKIIMKIYISKFKNFQSIYYKIKNLPKIPCYIYIFSFQYYLLGMEKV